MLKMMKGPQPAAVAAAAAPAAAPTGTGAGSGPRRGCARDDGAGRAGARRRSLADSDVAPDAESGQLLSIDSFSTKDPFAQQSTEAVPSDPNPVNDSRPPGAGDGHSERLRRPGRHVRSARLEPAGSGSERSPGEHHSVGRARPADRDGDDDLDQRRDGKRRIARGRSRPRSRSSSSSRSPRTASPL